MINVLYYFFWNTVGLHGLVNVGCSPELPKEDGKVPFGSNLNVSCIANVSSNAGLKLVGDDPLWPADDKGNPLTKKHGGVLDISKTNVQNTSASRMLHLRASVIDGTKWPKPFRCAARFRLPDGDVFTHYGETVFVDFDSELH